MGLDYKPWSEQCNWEVYRVGEGSEQNKVVSGEEVMLKQANRICSVEEYGGWGPSLIHFREGNGINGNFQATTFKISWKADSFIAFLSTEAQVVLA